MIKFSFSCGFFLSQVTSPVIAVCNKGDEGRYSKLTNLEDAVHSLKNTGKKLRKKLFCLCPCLLDIQISSALVKFISNFILSSLDLRPTCVMMINSFSERVDQKKCSKPFFQEHCYRIWSLQTSNMSQVEFESVQKLSGGSVGLR